MEPEAEKKLKQQLLISVVDAATGAPVEANLPLLPRMFPIAPADLQSMVFFPH